MKFTDKERGWIRANKFIIQAFIKRREEEYKNIMVDMEDPVQRENLRLWLKEFRVIQAILNKSDKETKPDNFTGI